MAGNRGSSDPQERMEWQLDQIRQGIYVLVVVILVPVVVGVAAAVITA